MPEKSGIYNWALTHRICDSDRLVEIESEEQLLDLFSRSTSTRFRILGSRYSHTDLLHSEEDHKVIVLSRLTGLIKAEDDGVWFWGGSPLKDVFTALMKINRLIACAPGVISEQTLAGAISTGTHGQGLNQCSLSDAVVALRLISIDGYIYDIDENHPWFQSAILGLGCLGVITRVKVATRPLVDYVCLKVTTDVDTFQSQYVNWNSQYEMVKAWWFPDEGRVHVWLSGPVGKCENVEIQKCGIDEAVDNSIQAMQRDTREKSEDAKVYQTVNRFRDQEQTVDNLYAIWCKGIPVPQINVEIAVSLDRFEEAVLKLRQLLQSNPERTHYPIIFRCTGPSRANLSPAGQTKEVCHIGFVVYFGHDGYVSVEGASFVYKAEKLLSELDGRPHWGKYYTPQFYNWDSLYPRLSEFKRLQDVLDPNRRLSDDCESLLLHQRSRMPYNEPERRPILIQ